MGKSNRWNEKANVLIGFEAGELPTEVVSELGLTGQESGQLVLRCKFSGYYDPGVSSGSIEKCYPEEGDDIREVITAEISVSDGKDYLIKNESLLACLEEAYREQIYQEEIPFESEEEKNDRAEYYADMRRDY